MNLQSHHQILLLSVVSFCHNKFVSFISAIGTELYKTFISKKTLSKGQLQRQKSVLDESYSDLIWHLKNVFALLHVIFQRLQFYKFFEWDKILVSQCSQVNFLGIGFPAFIIQEQYSIAEMIIRVDFCVCEHFEGLQNLKLPSSGLSGCR